MLRFESLPGLTPYSRGLDFLLDAQERRIRSEIPDTVFFMEHSPVVTQGRGLQDDGTNRPRVQNRPELPVGVDYVELNRGGGLTVHSPGMLMIYPIIELGSPNGFCPERDVGLFLRKLEEVIIRTLDAFEIQAFRRSNATGVWIEKHPSELLKIASMGISVRKWVTLHGAALNVTNDLALFNGINPCGFDSSLMTRMADLQPVDIEQVKGMVTQQLNADQG